VASMEERSYDKIQRGKEGDLERVKANLEEAVRIKKDKKLDTTLGVQCLLLPDNMEQLPDMAKQLREIGVDYLTIKPYSQHLHSENIFQIDYEAMLELEQEMRQYAAGDFAVYFRANAMKKMHRRKCYRQCYGLPFMTHIDARGNVWPCVAHIGTDKFCYGNIYEQTFEEIWEGDKRQEVMRKINSLNINEVCRENVLEFYDILLQKEFKVDLYIPETSIFVQGDKDALQRILYNLLSNVMRYGAEGKYLGVFLRQDKNSVYIDVVDKGKGIEQEFISNVFDRLYTIEDSRNREIQGNGLGLTIAKNLAKSLGGDIFLSSVPNVKTTFTVKLKKISYLVISERNS